MKNFRRRNGRTDSNRRAIEQRSAAGRMALGRVLRAEQLEQRQLLAGDVEMAPHQNSWAAKDVNSDLRITPLDALIVINELNRGGTRELTSEPVKEGKFVDVNGDNRITSIDALQVLNALNRGEGADVPVVEVMIGLTSDSGTNLVDQATRTANLSVGQIVNLEILYTDARRFGAGLGLFTVYTDILMDQTGVLEPLVTETQVLSLTENLIDGTGGSFTLTQAGNGTISTIPFTAVADDPPGAIRNALINDFGFTANQISVTQELREPRDVQNGTPGGPFELVIRFLGDSFIDVDVPNFSIDASGVTTSTGQPIVGSSREIPAKINGNVNPAAVGYSLDPVSRTGNGAQVYTNVRQGTYNDDPNDNVQDGFSNIGATGQLNAGGMPVLVPGYQAAVPYEAFSIRARVVKPTTDLDLSLQIPLKDQADPNESVLVIYGNRQDGTSGDERGLSPAEYVLDTDSQLKINVTAAVNAVADTITTNEDVAGTVNVLANDTNQGSGTLTIISTTNGANGTVSFNGGVVTYTPAQDFFGTDQFTYTAQNGDGDTGIGTVNVTVNSVNDPPTASNFSITVTEGTQRELANSEFISRSSAGPANEGQTPVLQAISTAAQGTAILNGDGSVTYTAPTAYEGPDSFTYTISDGVATVTATVSIAVVDKNDPPEAVDDTINGTEDTPITFTEQEFAAAVLANDSPGPANEVANGQVVTLQSIDATGSAGGTWVANANGSYTYTPPQDVFGTAAETFNYTITDGELTDSGVITINLAPVNDAPIATNDSLIVDELTSNNVLTVLDNDSPGPLETGTISIVNIVSNPTNGTASVSADGLSIVYTPNDTFVGTDTLTYRITDGDLTSNVATVSIDVVPVIRPRARNDQFTVAEDSGKTTLNITQNDLPNENATVVLTSAATNIPATQGTLVVNGNSVDFTPADDFFGSVVFTYRISDTSNPVIDDPDEIAASTGTVTVTVTPVNDAPVFVADPVVTAVEDTAKTIQTSDLLANDGTGAANENDTLSVSGVSAASAQGGTVTFSSGVITYTPRADYNSAIVAQDTFTYTISDGAGGTTTGTVTVSVSPVNDVPVLDLSSLTANEDVAAVFGQLAVLGNSKPGPATATDEASQTLSIVSVGTNGLSAAGGTVSVANGQVTYTSAANFFGQDTFAVTVRDSAGAQSIGTVTISVNNVNDPPVLGSPSLLAFSQSIATYTSAQLLAGSNVGPGESGVAGQILSVVSARAVTGTTLGGVQYNDASGSVTYTPPGNDFVGTDRFEITISDGVTTTTGLVSVDVREFEPSTISGSVFFDMIESIQNPVRNGQQDANEPGLEMTQVRLVSGAAENVTGIAINHPLMTDRDGSFEFTNVPPGTYRLIFDMPLMVYDGPDTAGSLGDSDTVENQFTISIPEPGGFVGEDYNFTVLGFSGRAGNAMDLLVSNYMRSNPGMAADSNNGMLGAKAYVDATGKGQWFVSKAGFEDAMFGEINLDQSGSTATLSVILNDGTVKTGIIPSDRRVILADGNNGWVVQIFGSLDSFSLQADGSIDPGELGLLRYQSAVDSMLAQEGSVI